MNSCGRFFLVSTCWVGLVCIPFVSSAFQERECFLIQELDTRMKQEGQVFLMTGDFVASLNEKAARQALSVRIVGDSSMPLINELESRLLAALDKEKHIRRAIETGIMQPEDKEGVKKTLGLALAIRLREESYDAFRMGLSYSDRDKVGYILVRRHEVDAQGVLSLNPHVCTWHVFRHLTVHRDAAAPEDLLRLQGTADCFAAQDGGLTCGSPAAEISRIY